MLEPTRTFIVGGNLMIPNFYTFQVHQTDEAVLDQVRDPDLDLAEAAADLSPTAVEDLRLSLSRMS